MTDESNGLGTPEIDMGAYRIRQIEDGVPRISAWVFRDTRGTPAIETWALLRPGQMGGYEVISSPGGALYFQGVNTGGADLGAFLKWLNCVELPSLPPFSSGQPTWADVTFYSHSVDDAHPAIPDCS